MNYSTNKPFISVTLRGVILLPVSLMLILLSSCSENGTSVEQPITEDVTNYLQALPSWSQFAPPGQTQPPTAAGEAQAEEDVTLDVEVIKEDGSLDLLENVTYSCQVHGRRWRSVRCSR